MINIYTSLPVGLCQYALSNRKVNHLKLYLLLKFKTSGYFKYDECILENIGDFSKELKLHKKTVISCFKWLIKNKWITINSLRKSIHIKGYKSLCRKLNIELKSSVQYETDNLEELKAICCASVILYYRNKLRYLNRQSGANMTLSAKNCRLVSKGYYFIPLEYLAKALDISKTTAFNFKKEALKYGFIDCVRNIFDVTDNTGKPIPVEAYGVYLKFYSKKNRLRKGKKYLKEVGSDLINGNVKLKKFRF